MIPSSRGDDPCDRLLPATAFQDTCGASETIVEVSPVVALKVVDGRGIYFTYLSGKVLLT